MKSTQQAAREIRTAISNHVTENYTAAQLEAYANSRTTHTGNGYDPRWIACINTVLEDRETGIQITDILEGLWDEHIGPMIDAIEDGRARQTANNAGLVEYAE